MCDAPINVDMHFSATCAFRTATGQAMIRTPALVLLAGAWLVPSPGRAASDIVIPAIRLTPPPPVDRQVAPFEGSLGRPCGYRWRATPSGTRKVRVCF
ncbi:hypothetical protein ASG40_15270 [Methylobacterium sp. Leaf399]|nr:hypothetical protein ASG40_15270 [Methylobacterium sp. Leaf399]